MSEFCFIILSSEDLKVADFVQNISLLLICPHITNPATSTVEMGQAHSHVIFSTVPYVFRQSTVILQAKLHGLGIAS